MKLVIPIMLLATVGTIALVFLCRGSQWGFVYLVKYRLLKKSPERRFYEPSTRHDVLAAIACIVTLIVVALLLMYGLPIIIENADWFKNTLGTN